MAEKHRALHWQGSNNKLRGLVCAPSRRPFQGTDMWEAAARGGGGLKPGRGTSPYGTLGVSGGAICLVPGETWGHTEEAQGI